MAAPWRDALKRGGAPLPPEQGATRPAADATAEPGIDPAKVSPELAALIKEREALQSSIESLRGAGKVAGTDDPRFRVAPLAERRAEIESWLQSRRTQRPRGTDSDPPVRGAASRTHADKPKREPAAGETGSIAGRMLGGLDARRNPASPPLRPTPGEAAAGRDVHALRASVAERARAAPAMRPTPGQGANPAAPGLRPTRGETPGGGGTPASSAAFAAMRDAARALTGRPASSETPRRRRGADDKGDSGFLDRAFDRWESLRDKPRAVEAALDRARRAIPDEWEERARRAVPALGIDDSYERRMKKLLKVAVGTIDQLSEQSDRMRALARDVRELREADAANDEARRERAIERLKAKREEGA